LLVRGTPMASRSSDPSGALPPPPRLWTAGQANARLPGLEELLPRLKGWVVRLREVRGQQERLAAFWGAEVDAPDHSDHALKARLDAEWENLTRRLEEAVAGLRAEGIELKDLDGGLVDFYALERGELVFLCWRLGEARVDFYHPIDGGFRNRRPLSTEGPVAPGGTARARGSL
jgi:hypothetical protein